jgi:hypothetical protein
MKLKELDRLVTFHVYQDGKIAVVIACPVLDMVISRIVLQSGWQYASVLFDRFEREWKGLEWKVQVTFETDEQALNAYRVRNS